MDGNTTREQDTAELAVSYSRVEEARKEFWQRMAELMPAYQELTEARRALDSFKERFKTKHIAMARKK